MPIQMERRDTLDVALACGLSDYPFWASCERRLTDADIACALAEDRLIAPDDGRDPNAPMSAEEHAARVAWLVRHGDYDRFSVTLRDGKLADGNHRFAAALFAGVETLTCVLMGDAAEMAEAA